MNPQEKEMLDELFQQLRQMEAESGPRTAAATAYLQSQLQRQPHAPYYMAQLLLLQKQSLANAKTQIADLQAQLGQHAYDRPARHSYRQEEGYGQSFLAGAAQAALAVGGGLLLADFVGDLLGYAFGNEWGYTDNRVDVNDDGSQQQEETYSVETSESDFTPADEGEGWGFF